MQIGEFAQRTGLSPDTLRYYEKIGLMPKPGRNRAGRREYSDDHIRWVDFLQVLRSTGMGVRDMARYAALRKDGAASAAERLEILSRHQARVAAERRRLADVAQLLDAKIAMFRGVCDGSIDPNQMDCSSGDTS